MGFSSDSKHEKEDSPPPYLDTSSVMTFEVDYAGWKRYTTIRDPTGQAIFTSHTPSSCSTRLQVEDNRGQTIGSSKSSNLSSKIDVNMNDSGKSFDIHNSASIFGGSPGYTSPAFNSAKVVWKNKAWSTKIIYTLIDGNGQAVARFESNWRTQIGKLELTHEAVSEQRINEVVVTLLSLLHRKLRNIEMANYAAVS